MASSEVEGIEFNSNHIKPIPFDIIKKAISQSKDLKLEFDWRQQIINSTLSNSGYTIKRKIKDDPESAEELNKSAQL